MAKIASATTAGTSSTPSHDEIAAQAYQIYLREGCIEGRDLDHWLRAEAELRERVNGNGAERHAGAIASIERSAGPGRAAAKQEQPIIANSVLPPSTAIAQVTRSTTPRRN